MPRHIEFDIGTAGLALLRGWLVGDPATAERIVAEVRAIAAGGGDAPRSRLMPQPERDVAEGYALWAATYDVHKNPLLAAEGRAMRELLVDFRPGVALDAACGTGRQAGLLLSLGHTVTGIDASPEMLAVARARHPSGDFRLGRLEALPMPDGCVDLVTCSLALTHFSDLVPPLRELRRVTRPGGRIVLSDVHPVLVIASAQAGFKDVNLERGFIRNHIHWTSNYLHAFRQIGLDVEDCVEAPYLAEDVATFWPAESGLSFQTMLDAFEGLPAALCWVLSRPDRDG